MSRKQLQITTASADATYQLGKKLGRLVPAGTVLAVSGQLGAGKTVFAAGFAAGLGVADAVTSPTFIFFNEYQGRLPFCHIDAYRLEDMEEEEKALVGLEECFLPHKVALAEWPQFISEWLPEDCINAEISGQGSERCICFDYPEKEGWLDEAVGN